MARETLKPICPPFRRPNPVDTPCGRHLIAFNAAETLVGVDG